MLPALMADFSVIDETLCLLIEDVATAAKRCETRHRELEQKKEEYLEKVSRELLPDLRRRTFRELASLLPITRNFPRQYASLMFVGGGSPFMRILMRREYRHRKKWALDTLRIDLMMILGQMRGLPRSLSRISEIDVDIAETCIMRDRLDLRRQDLESQLEQLNALRSAGDEIDGREMAAIAEAAGRARVCRSQPIVPTLLAEDNDNFAILQIDSA